MQRPLQKPLVTGAIAAGLTVSAVVPAVALIYGTGASLPDLVYGAWCQQSRICSYTGSGSGQGITNFINKIQTFEATDTPLNGTQLKELAGARGGVTPLYFPTFLAAVAIPVHINGVGRLNLDGKVLGDIFDGKLTTWNNVEVTSLNPKAHLPKAPIIACVRADSAGTSYQFSLFLDKTNTGFRTSVGGPTGTPNWKAPHRLGGVKNTGVANCVQSNNDSIGYVDLSSAEEAGLGRSLAAIGQSYYVTKTVTERKGGTTIKVTKKVAAERFILPSIATIEKDVPKTITLHGAALQDELAASAIPGAYPITITTYVLAYSSYKAAGDGSALAGVKQFLNYAYGTGQGELTPYSAAPLPKTLLAAAKAQEKLLH